MHLLPADTPSFITVAHFVKLTGASRAFAYKLIKSGDLVAIRLGDRSVIRIPRGELERFLKRRVVT